MDGITKEQFKQEYIANSEITSELFDEHFIIVECDSDCDYENCKGWKAESKLLHNLMNHEKI